MRISTLSLEEYVSLVAAFHSLNEKEPDFSRHKPAQIEKMRKFEKFNPVKTLNMTFTKAFRNFPCEGFDYLTTLFGQYDRHGVLPFAGSLSEQPAKIIEVFNVLKALSFEAQAKEQKKTGKVEHGRQRKS